MNEEHDEEIINKYIKTMQITYMYYVHVNFQQYAMVGKNKEKELCCVILKIIIIIIILILLIIT